MRRLHRAHRWRADAFMPSRDRHARQKSRNHHRIVGAKRHAASGAASLDRSRRGDHQYLPLRNLSAGAGGDPCRGERGLAAMNDAANPQAAASYAEKAWQSDVIVDLIKQYGFPYTALNP